MHFDEAEQDQLPGDENEQDQQPDVEPSDNDEFDESLAGKMLRHSVFEACLLQVDRSKFLHTLTVVGFLTKI